MKEFEVITMSNGLRVVTVEMPHLHTCEIAVYFKVGSGDDPKGKSGLAHFLEHMMFQGNSMYSRSSKMDEAFELIGGDVNAETCQEITNYYARVHPNHVVKGLEMLASLVTTPKLRGFKNEKSVIIEEALEEINERNINVNPDNIAAKIMWPEESIGEPILGTLDSIKGITLHDVKKHMSGYYTPDNAILIAAGRIDKNEIRTASENYFSSWTGKRMIPEPVFSNFQNSPNVTFIRDIDSQVRVNMAFRGLPRNHDNELETWFLRWLLCCGGTSRLYKNLREKKGFVYGIHSSVDNFNEAGAMTVGFSTSAVNLEKATAETFSEIKKLLTKGIPASEVKRVKASYNFDLDYSMDNESQLLSRYARGILFGKVRSVEDDKKRVDRITSESLVETARRIFKVEHLNYVAVGCWNPKTKKTIEKLIRDLKF